eukprot:jgi/Psemu1/23785/gm1.23785_g
MRNTSERTEGYQTEQNSGARQVFARLCKKVQTLREDPPRKERATEKWINGTDCHKHFSSDGAVYKSCHSAQVGLEILSNFDQAKQRATGQQRETYSECHKYFSSNGFAYIHYYSPQVGLEILSNYERTDCVTSISVPTALPTNPTIYHKLDWKYYQPPNIFNNQPTTSTMPKKRRTAGGTQKPQTNINRKKTLLAQERSREVTRIHQEDDESMKYEEVPTDDDEEYAYVDPEAYTELLPARVATSYKCIRQSIALIFELALDTPPAEDWKKLKTISFICDCFKDDRRAFQDTVIQVCTDVLYCQDDGIFCCSGKGNYSTTGRHPIIALDSIEVEVVADSIESGNSLRMSTVVVNKYRKKLELPSFTYSAVRGCMLRLNPLIKTVKRGKQGSKTKEDAWCRALFRWFAQLLLRFGGKIDFSHAVFWKLLGEAYVENQPPPCYDVALLTPLKPSRIVWFGKIHMQCHIGQSGSCIGPGRPNVAISFKRNEFGKLDPNGKYEHEAQFCLGVFMMDDDKAIYGKESVQQIPKLKGKTFEKLQQHGLVLVRDLKSPFKRTRPHPSHVR